MASVLAQEEVDALLQGVASDDLGIEEEEDLIKSLLKALEKTRK